MTDSILRPPIKTKKTPTLQDVTQAYIKCAKIVDTYGERYLPIFHRLERELNTLQSIEAAKKRATRISQADNCGTLIGTHFGTQNGQN